MSREFIGAGLAFPLAIDRTGQVALVHDTREIEEAIRIILGTAPGERPMRPEFGCRIHDHIFDPLNDATVGLIAYEVFEALARWEPRVTVESVDVLLDHAEPGTVYLDITYTVRDENDPRNLVFPFYMIPGEE